MLWAISGIGMLFNAISGASKAAKARKQTEQMRQQVEQMKAAAQQSIAGTRQQLDRPVVSFESQLPAFPQKNYDNLQNMQQHHFMQQQTMRQGLQSQLGTLRDSFFSKHHYAVEMDASGRPQVQLDSYGRPVIADGAESYESKIARQTYEADQRRKLNSDHGDQRESFMTEQKGKVQGFLQQFGGQLNEKQCQADLQKMIINGKKDAFSLQQTQDREVLMGGLPNHLPLREEAQEGIFEMQALQQRHLEAEEHSPDMKALMGYEQDVSQILFEKRQEAAELEQKEQFLMGRDQRREAISQTDSKDFSRVLPSYLTQSLYDMGIYEIG